MYMFNLSDDYVGISFIITLNNSFNVELNKEIIGDVEDEINYIKMYVGSKKRVSYNQPSKEIIRKNKIETILLEVKMRVYDFLKQYINLPLLNDYAPICLEEYITNYKKEDNNYFLRCYDFYSFIFERKYDNFPINKEINYYEGILNSVSIKYYSRTYINKDIKSTFNYQRSRYKYLYNKNKMLDQEFNNYIDVKSSKDSLHLAKISIYIAIISILITMFFSILSYVGSNNEKYIPIIIFTEKEK